MFQTPEAANTKLPARACAAEVLSSTSHRALLKISRCLVSRSTGYDYRGRYQSEYREVAELGIRRSRKESRRRLLLLRFRKTRARTARLVSSCSLTNTGVCVLLFWAAPLRTKTIGSSASFPRTSSGVIGLHATHMRTSLFRSCDSFANTSLSWMLAAIHRNQSIVEARCGTTTLEAPETPERWQGRVIRSDDAAKVCGRGLETFGISFA
jgi:hypothetical protein